MTQQQVWQAGKQRALQLARENRVEEALRSCRELVAEQPADPDLIHALAVLHGQAGDFPAGERYARKLIALCPALAVAHITLARLLQAMQRPEEAVASLQLALKLQPGIADAWLQLANLQSQLGDAGAGTSFAKALQLEPANIAAWHDQGVWLQAQGEAGRAIDSYREAVRLSPQSATLYASLGSGLHASSALAEAAACYRQSLQLHPDDPPTLLNLANVNFDQAEYAHAAVRYQQLLRIQPEHEEALLGLAMAYRECARPDDALECYQKLARLAPGDPLHHNRLGSLYLEFGRHEDALAAFREALRLAPGDATYLLNVGIAYEYLGRLDDALAHFQAMADSGHAGTVDLAGSMAGVYEKQGQPAQAWQVIQGDLQSGCISVRAMTTALRLCHHHDACDLVVARAGDLLADAGLADHDRRLLNFALGARQDKLRNYDAAFAAYADGNRLKRVSYSEADDVAYVDNLIRQYSAADYTALRKAGSRTSRVPVFIIGMPRSGTSLVEQILSCHTQVHAAGELRVFPQLVERMAELAGRGKSYPDLLPLLSGAALDEVAEHYLTEVTAMAPGAGCITDKMPHNFAYVGLIRAVFPEAAIIHCLRNPMDTCLSCYFQDFSGYHNYAYDLDHLAGHYLQYQRMMQFWKDVLQIDMHEVQYEVLVEQPEQQVRALLQHCGLDWQDACLDFHTSARHVRTASYDQVRQPLYLSSRERWRNYERHIGRLIERLAGAGTVMPPAVSQTGSPGNHDV